jgi:rubrerythrin
MIKRADDDPASRRMLEEILASEEEHAENLTSLLKEFCPDPIPAGSTDSGATLSYSMMPSSKA